jgi:hypothetical protein
LLSLPFFWSFYFCDPWQRLFINELVIVVI